jgi:hypothetical protein
MIGLIGYRYNIKKQQKTQLHQFKYNVLKYKEDIIFISSKGYLALSSNDSLTDIDEQLLL